MVQPDTLQFLNDSSKVLSDSLAKIDSITAADSIHSADSLKSIVQIPHGFIGISHPSIPQTESWVFIILVLLFSVFVYSLSQSVGLISDTIRSFFQVKERSSIFSKATVNDSRFRFFLIIFSIGTISLYAYFLLHNSAVSFSIKEFSLFLVATSLFFAVKSLIFDLIGYVFFTLCKLKNGERCLF